MKNLFLIIVLFFTSIFINLQAQAPGNSLNFDGVNDAVGTPLFVPFGGDFTIETWIKTTSTAGRSEIISWGNSSTSNNSVAEFRLASGKLQFLFNGTSGLQYFTSSANVN